MSFFYQAYGDKKRRETLFLSFSDPGGILTHNLLIRSQMLYTVELRGRNTWLVSQMRCKGITLFFKIQTHLRKNIVYAVKYL